VALAEGDPVTALTHAQAASAAHSALPYPLEQGRSLLLEGVLQRRLGHRRAAREALSQALDTFECLGSPPWAGRSRAELSRLGGRSPSTGALTASETLVAEEVAQGLSNAQIAAALHLSVRTVESHLTSVYRKLDVSSRTQLVSTWSRHHTDLEVEAGTTL
jgi:DNA-binding NarL/FixJ family response regulator